MLAHKWKNFEISSIMIQYFDWLPFLESMKSVDCIEGELAIFNYSDLHSEFKIMGKDIAELMRVPHKFDFFVIAQHISGDVKLTINMEEYNIRGGGNMITIVPGHILSVGAISEDFDMTAMIMSRKFIESLMVYLNGTIPFRIDMHRQIVRHCSEQELKVEDTFIKAVRHALALKDNPYRLQLIQHVMMAIFYSTDVPSSLSQNGEMVRSNADVLSKKFIELLEDNFRKERQLQFYADALCITPRYLSRVVKECTGQSAADWIERYVVLEARALLKSTTMTVQQISDFLSFPSQTFFGKYFKRRVGMSPKEYRRVG